MRWWIAILVVGCGASVQPNEAQLKRSVTDAGHVITGIFGSDFTEAEIRDKIVAQQCRQAGLSVGEFSIEGDQVAATCV